MKLRVGRIVFGAVVALALLLPAAAGAQTALPGPCLDGDLPHDAKSRICVLALDGIDSLSCSRKVMLLISPASRLNSMISFLMAWTLRPSSNSRASPSPPPPIARTVSPYWRARTTFETSSTSSRGIMACRSEPFSPGHPKAAWSRRCCWSSLPKCSRPGSPRAVPWAASVARSITSATSGCCSTTSSLKSSLETRPTFRTM